MIEKISWKEILQRTGIKDIKTLALTIVSPACDAYHKNLVKFEYNEFVPFLEENNILEPYWEADKIPEDILLSFLGFLLESGYENISACSWLDMHNCKVKTITLQKDKLYQYVTELWDFNFLLTGDNKYCLKLPYHDLPYTLFLSNQSIDKVVSKLNFEGFSADLTTKIYWFL